MKEKTADIDILEDLLSTQKQYIEDKDYQKEHNIKEQAIDYAKMWTKATETLIAENKELKVNNKKLQDKCKELIFEKQELTSALLDSIPKDKIKAKIEEKIEWCIKASNSGLNAIQYACSKEDEIERIERQKNISTMISILKEILQELLDERNNTDE